MRKITVVLAAGAAALWSVTALADCGGHSSQTVSTPDPAIVVAGNPAPVTPAPTQPAK